MTLPDPLLRFWYAWSALGPSFRRTPWGTVVADSRYPLIFDANHAGVFERHDEVTADEIKAALHPALRAAGALYEHVEVWGGPARCPALEDLRRGAERQTEDVVMVLEEPPRVAGPATVEIRELHRPGDDVSAAYERTRQMFGGELDPETVLQMRLREREVLRPTGLRMFGAFVRSEIVGFANLLSLEGVGYVDTVVTLPAHRGRGVATAAVNRVVRESREAGDTTVHLLAEAEGRARRLYERLGFRACGTVRSVTRRLDPGAPATGVIRSGHRTRRPDDGPS